MFSKSVDRKLLLLIEKIALIDFLRKGFYLAGGTALAIHLGHRKSDDLDFFSPHPFNSEKVVQAITHFSGQILSHEPDTIHAIIGHVKTSFFLYPCQLLSETLLFRNLPIAAIPDIASMKAVAISQRATKKDFFDVYEILKDHSPETLKSWFLQKYGNKRINCYHILRSFFYFDDAEDTPDPISLNKTTWKSVKKYFLTNEKRLFQAFLSES